jgi:hypothetical protein
MITNSMAMNTWKITGQYLGYWGWCSIPMIVATAMPTVKNCEL